MTDTAANNRRIAKNTLMLYFRMLFVMGVALYTSRVVLQQLGIEDYGIYSVTAGVVSLLIFVNTSLSNASSRFINFAIAGKSQQKQQQTFCNIIIVQYIFIIIIFIIAETIGLWFVQTQLVIPENRLNAALWAYQGAIIMTIFSFLNTPYNALIIAHEKMSVFAYISIVETMAKLAIAYIISLTHSDKLIVYSILLAINQLIIFLIYYFYSKRQFTELNYKFKIDKNGIKKIISFSSWTMGGNIAVICCTQGLNILLNLFFGPIINAARGIASQVQSVINQFFTSFQTAINPQITQTYAANNLTEMHNLIIKSAKYSFYLSMFICLPILMQTEEILHIWLGTVPNDTAQFVRIMIFVGLNYAIGNSTITAIRATGDIRKFELIVSTTLIAILPICYLLLKLFSLSAKEVFIVYCIIECIAQFIRVYITFPKINLPIKYYYTHILFPIAKVCAIVWIIPVISLRYLHYSIYINLLLVICLCTISSIFSIYTLGIGKNEKAFLKSKLRQLISINNK